MPDFISKLFSKSFIKEFIKFAIVGALGTLVNIFILFLFTDIFKMYYIFSEIIAFITSGINNYLLDKIWAFKEELQEYIVRKYSQFLLISILSLLINLSILFILVEYFGWWYILAEIVAIICAFFINYLGNKFWTFKKQNKNFIESSSQMETTNNIAKA